MENIKNCVYILIREKDHKRYIGSTKDLSKRLMDHNAGRVKSTRLRRPLRVFAFRKFDTISEAAGFEIKYKKSSGQINRDIKNKKLKLRGVA